MMIADHAQHKCLEPWWEEKPRKTWTSWICRHRKKVGMSCQYDMDCLYGMRSCLLGKCQPLQPYNPNHLCHTDLDCKHVGYYCPDDPTKGEDPYFKKFCRRQLSEESKCTQDRECEPGMVCNDVERPPRCRKYFSIERGEKAKDSRLCITGHTDKYDVCSVAAKSKSVGRSCGSDEDCQTTDQTGKTAECTCKTWWDGGEPKYCLPIFGDLPNDGEKVRDWLWFRKNNCGSFWTDEECIEEFPESAQMLYDVYCEIQKMSNDVHPPKGCNIQNPKYQPQYTCPELDGSAEMEGEGEGSGEEGEAAPDGEAAPEEAPQGEAEAETNGGRRLAAATQRVRMWLSGAVRRLFAV
jgi:hypothetical protein